MRDNGRVVEKWMQSVTSHHRRLSREETSRARGSCPDLKTQTEVLRVAVAVKRRSNKTTDTRGYV